MPFLNCPACLDQDSAVRCGLPAEVRYRFTMRSTSGPLDSVMIACPAGHHFIEYTRRTVLPTLRERADRLRQEPPERAPARGPLDRAPAQERIGAAAAS